jgi:hypothetical protein
MIIQFAALRTEPQKNTAGHHSFISALDGSFE